MALVKTDGFDMYNGTQANIGLQSKWTTNVLASTSLVTGQFGGQALQCVATTGYWSNNLTATRSAGANGFALRFTTMPSSGSTAMHFMLGSASTAQSGIRVTPTGAIEAFRYSNLAGNAGTSLGVSANGVILNNTWHYVEVEWVISSTVGVINVYVDDVAVLTLSGKNTQNAALASADAVYIGVQTSGGGTAQYDNYYEADTSTRIGVGAVETLRPSADSAVTWTPNSGVTNFSRVNETLVDGDTSYNQTSTVGNADLFAMADLATLPATVYGVQLSLFAEKTDATARTIYSEIKSGGTTNDGSAFALASSYARFDRMLTTDPNTGSAWTAANVNAALGGYKVAS